MKCKVNIKKYFEHLSRLLNNQYNIDKPKKIEKLFTLRLKGGQILGWECENKQINFVDEGYLDVDEYAVLTTNDSECYEITKLSYHYNPSDQSNLLSFRFDMKFNNPLHANPDPRTNLNSHLTPNNLTLDIRDLNLYLSLRIVLKYISSKKYPLYNIYGNEYNNMLNKERRKLND